MEQHEIQKRLTKEERETLISELDNLYGHIYLKVDGYLVYAVRKPVSNSKLEIMVYVNGILDGKWFSKPGEIVKRFYRPILRYTYSKKYRDSMTKILGKRKAAKEGVNDKRTHWSLTWTDSRSFISHLIKHNENIEIISREQHDIGVKALKKDEGGDSNGTE
jgi:hypothetical protein